ncbi:MAG: class I SAM-dependent methyltransferase [Clostridia bacterium]|nr:class I SAM-dependent methyltransferase [Clostridia bacterium]
MKRRLISVIAGGLIGYLYYYFVGCRSGTCAITSNPFNSTIYGAVLSGLIVELLHDLWRPPVKRKSLFNTIAPIYALFYKRQKKHFLKILDNVQKEFDLDSFKTILDVGCGTGALCATFAQIGFAVTGIDPAEEMLNIAMRKTENGGITFIQASATERLPFEDKAFDLAIASYVAHGMCADQRQKMYEQMSRVAKSKVIIYDYNKNRALLTTIIEWLEQGDYFNFIRNAESEMRSCVSEMKKCFADVEVIEVSARASWYICTPAYRVDE